MDFRLSVETDRFNRALQEIGRMTDDPAWQKKVIDYEVAKILETTIARTHRATIQSIKKSQAGRDWVTIDAGRGRKKYLLTNRYSNAVWKQIQRALALILKRKTDAREYARQAWYELAKALGFEVKTTAQTRNAKVPGRDNATNVRKEVSSSGGKYGIYMENNSPLIRWSDGRQALYSAIVGRRKYFEQTMRKTYTDKIKPIAQRYGLTVS